MLKNVSLSNPQLSREQTREFTAARQMMRDVKDNAERLYNNLNGGYTDLDDSPDSVTLHRANVKNFMPTYSGFVSFEDSGKELNQANIFADISYSDREVETYYSFRTEGDNAYYQRAKTEAGKDTTCEMVTHNLAEGTLSYVVL